MFYKGKYYNVLIKNHPILDNKYTVLVMGKCPRWYSSITFYKLENALRYALCYVSESHAIQITHDSRFV